MGEYLHPAPAFILDPMARSQKSKTELKSKVPAGELALIERIRRRVAHTKIKGYVQLGIGDDCAILRPPTGHEILVTTDFSLEGRHFRRDWHSPASIGHRTLARGLSDLASMGAKPLAAFLSLALPRSIAADTAWLDGYLDGLLTLASQNGTHLAGGDTSESPSDHILADIVLLGSAPRGRALRRSGAHPGDLLYCTGALGGASAELASLPSKKLFAATPAGNHPHLFPRPRLAVGQALLHRKLATACIDLSDGLSTDLTHLCEASNVRAEVEAASLPLHPLAAGMADAEGLHAALHGGEDYELLFTASPKTKVPKSIAGVPITRIGRMLPNRRSQSRITLHMPDGSPSPLQPGGWEHFQ